MVRLGEVVEKVVEILVELGLDDLLAELVQPLTVGVVHQAVVENAENLVNEQPAYGVL